MSAPTPGWQSRVLAFAHDHPTAAGHFPGNPILPGALLLAHALRAAGQDTTPSRVRQAKFFAPVRPGEALELRWCATTEGGVQFELRRDTVLVMSAVLGGPAT